MYVRTPPGAQVGLEYMKYMGSPPSKVLTETHVACETHGDLLNRSGAGAALSQIGVTQRET